PRVQRAGIEEEPGGGNAAQCSRRERTRNGPGSGGRGLREPFPIRGRGPQSPHKLSGVQLAGDATTGLLFPLEWSGRQFVSQVSCQSPVSARMPAPTLYFLDAYAPNNPSRSNTSKHQPL